MEEIVFNGKTYKIASPLSNANGAVYASKEGEIMALVPLNYTGSRKSPVVTVCYERFNVRELVCRAWNGAPPDEDSRTVLVNKESLVFSAANLRWGTPAPRTRRAARCSPELHAAILECAESGADAKMIAEALGKPLYVVKSVLERNLI